MHCCVLKALPRNSFLFLISQEYLDERIVRMNKMCILEVLNKRNSLRRHTKDSGKFCQVFLFGN